MNNQENMDDDVMNILAILQQSPTAKQAEPAKAEKKSVSTANVKTPKKETPSVNAGKEKAHVEMGVKSEIRNLKPETGFMANINEPEDKSIYNSKVLIREEIYEIFMSLKRTKKFKSVSTLIDFALEDYIKRHKEDIKKTLFENKKRGIL